MECQAYKTRKGSPIRGNNERGLRWLADVKLFKETDSQDSSQLRDFTASPSPSEHSPEKVVGSSKEIPLSLFTEMARVGI